MADRQRRVRRRADAWHAPATQNASVRAGEIPRCMVNVVLMPFGSRIERNSSLRGPWYIAGYTSQ